MGDGPRPRGNLRHAVWPRASQIDLGPLLSSSNGLRHGLNATQTTDNGNCENSADNPNKGGTTGGTNTGHGFVPN